MENQISTNQTDNRVVVPYDKGRKNITFYDTFVDINGDVIKYDEIAVIQSSALNSSSMIYFYFDRSFRYEFNFTTYDGKVHKFKRHGYSGYGIGTYKRVKNEFEPVADPMYDIVLKKVFERICERIENGATVKICGLTITKDKITLEKRKQTVVIDKNNFAAANVSNFSLDHSAQIFLKDEKRPVFKVSLNEPNARLIVPLANYLMRQQA